LAHERKRAALEEKRAELERMRTEAAQAREKREKRAREQRQAAEAWAAADLEAKWASCCARVQVDIVDKINVYEDDDAPEELSILLSKAVGSAEILTLFSCSW